MKNTDSKVLFRLTRIMKLIIAAYEWNVACKSGIVSVYDRVNPLAVTCRQGLISVAGLISSS